MEEIKIACRAANILPIDSIIEFQGKLKKITKANMEKLKKSILKNGFTAPIFIWEDAGDNKILDGHQRLATLIKMRQEGYDIPLLPVAYIYADDEAEARRKLLAITSQYGEFDALELADWLDELDDDIKDTLRFVDEEMIIESDKNIETSGDDEIPDNIEAVTKLGDLWELGNHRVLCGDSTDAETVARLMDGKKADMVFTDPPYGMSYGGGRAKGDNVLNKKTGGVLIKAHGMIIGDDLKGENLINLVKDSISLFFNMKKKGGAIYVCFTWRTYSEFENALIQVGADIKSCIVWDKKSIGLGISNYRPQHEFIFYCKRQWHGNRAQSDIWSMSRGATGEYVHPTQKPVELIEIALNNSSKIEDIISDAFLGSGTTLIACEKINRICYGMEIDPHYCDVIVYRYRDWCKTNDRTPIIKLNGEDYEL